MPVHPRITKRLKRTAVPLYALLLTVAPALQAQQLTDRLPVDPNVTVGRLPNGVSYYIRVNRKPEARAELRLAVNAGSLLEDDKQLGLAHFVEHMAFNGTKNFEKHELIDYLESMGMRFGADLNAYTGFEDPVRSTCYRISLRALHPSKLFIQRRV